MMRNLTETDWTPPDDLNPGIRQTVLWLREHGFDTFDSGDGKTHMMEGDAEFPYVGMRVDPKDMVSEAHRLHELLMKRLDEVAYTYNEVMEFDGTIPDDLPPHVEASYDPVSRIAIITLAYADDEILQFK